VLPVMPVDDFVIILAGSGCTFFTSAALDEELVTLGFLGDMIEFYQSECLSFAVGYLLDARCVALTGVFYISLFMYKICGCAYEEVM
jgi:hypothetical protein